MSRVMPPPSSTVVPLPSMIVSEPIVICELNATGSGQSITIVPPASTAARIAV